MWRDGMGVEREAALMGWELTGEELTGWGSIGVRKRRAPRDRLRASVGLGQAGAYGAGVAGSGGTLIVAPASLVRQSGARGVNAWRSCPVVIERSHVQSYVTDFRHQPPYEGGPDCSCSLSQFQ